MSYRFMSHHLPMAWRLSRLPAALLIVFLTTATATATVTSAHAAMGFTQLPATATDGPVTLFYPTEATEAHLEIGRGLDLSVANEARPASGNGRLVMISHGSGASPWVHSDLARSLVEAGFVVAIPEHRGDNYLDLGHPGPDSWAIRPAEISRAIDSIAQDPRFRGRFKLDRVGLYGMSAGGHTALSLAGGRWSRAGFMRHCDAHLADDFQACVGLASRLTGGSQILRAPPPSVRRPGWPSHGPGQRTGARARTRVLPPSEYQSPARRIQQDVA